VPVGPLTLSGEAVMPTSCYIELHAHPKEIRHGLAAQGQACPG
jgi:hypothetical protein